MSNKKILLLIVRTEQDKSPTTQENIEERCSSLSNQLNIELEVRVISSSKMSGQIHELTKDADALIVNIEGYSGSPASITTEKLRSFEALAQSGIPIVEVHERNIFCNDESRPYLDSPATGAGVVSGMGTHGYAVAIRALASKLERKAA